MRAERFEARSYRNQPLSFNRRSAQRWMRVGEGAQLGEHGEAGEPQRSLTEWLARPSPTAVGVWKASVTHSCSWFLCTVPEAVSVWRSSDETRYRGHFLDGMFAFVKAKEAEDEDD
jgi:hypothetical protein